MTREELDRVFIQHKEHMMKFVQKKGLLAEDAEDLIQTVYLRAISGNEYQEAPSRSAKMWCFYKLRRHMQILKKSRKVEQAILDEYASDLTTQKNNDELSDLEQYETLETYWNGLSRPDQSKLRSQWEKEGRNLFPFMARKKGGRSAPAAERPLLARRPPPLK